MTSPRRRVRSLLTPILSAPAPASESPTHEATGYGARILLPRWLAPLQRRTSGRPLLAVVDGLRFYAIGTVLLYHIFYNLHHLPDAAPESSWLAFFVRLCGRGAFGVQLFFVISGMVLGLPFANAAKRGSGAGVPLGRYFSRRLTRLEPPFLLSIALMYLVRAWVMHVPDLAPHLLATALYSHNWWYGEVSRISAVTWSLEVEVQFYILAPLLGQLYRLDGVWRRRGAWLFAMAAVQGLQLVLPAAGVVFLGQYLCYFLAGMLLADLTVFSWDGGRAVPWHPLWDVVGGLAGVGLWWSLEHGVGGQLGRSLGVLLLYVAIFRGAALYRFTIRPVVFTFGGMCYTIYLYHNLILRGLFERTPLFSGLRGLLGVDGALIGAALIASVVVAGFSAVLFAAVERPCMDPQWFARLRGRILPRS